MTTPESGMPQHLADYRDLVPEHALDLFNSAITPETAERHGVRSVTCLAELPEKFHHRHEQFGDTIFPGLLLPMQEPDGTERMHFAAHRVAGKDKYGKPSKVSTIVGKDGPIKYDCPAGEGPELPVIRENPDANELWIVEGDKQTLAADSWAPDGPAIYRICGITGWSRSGVPTRHLKVVDGKRVIIWPDADASTNPNVYDGARALGEHCKDEGAKEVRFVHLQGGKAGVDDHLARKDPERRTAWLIRKAASAKLKPADKRPNPPTEAQAAKAQKANAQAAANAAGVQAGRPLVHVEEDRYDVIRNLVSILKEGRDKDRLFSFGGRLARTVANDGSMITEHVDEGLIYNLLAANATLVKGIEDEDVDADHALGACSHEFTWPDGPTVKAVLGRHRSFRPLRGIAPSPVLREDGTVADTPGYDEVTGLLLDLDGVQLGIPAVPTAEQVRDAVDLLLDEWLGDFPFATPADRANALAFVLTYPLRELCGLVPLAVVSATSPGTGKSLFLSLVVRLFTRHAPEMDSLPSSDDETRKQITALLEAASPFVVFDESPEIRGKSLARLLTASTWSDRLLGATERVRLPNRAVMAATGNNVQVIGDLRRRTYPITLRYDDPDPENRPATSFRHADVARWTDENRGNLLSAVFTLIRAWVVQGRPERTPSFGSFEGWEAVIGGVLQIAGVENFLGNLLDHRQSTDYIEGHWVAHYEWLASAFPDGTFTTTLAVDRLRFDPNAETPPELEDVDVKGYPWSLGKAYALRDGRWSGGFRVVKDGSAGGHKAKWRIEKLEPVSAPDAESEQQRRPDQSPEDDPVLRAETSTPSSSDTDGEIRVLKGDQAGVDFMLGQFADLCATTGAGAASEAQTDRMASVALVDASVPRAAGDPCPGCGEPVTAVEDDARVGRVWFCPCDDF